MEIKEKISEWVDAHRAELISDTARLVAVRSVRGEPAPDAPFGPGPKQALDTALALCREYGFAVRDYDGCVGTADLNDLPSNLDILGHLDVVGEGGGWETDPYTAVEKDDGCLYGRGTDDDKGPVAAAILAMRCVRELGVPLRHGVRLIMGTDEESGSGDLPHYYAVEKPAPNTFTPDSGFPVYNVEKGGYKPVFTMAWEKTDALPRVSSLAGGFRINVIPAEAKAVVLGMTPERLRRLSAALVEKCGVAAAFREVPDGAEMTVTGRQAHAASPWEGNNGLTALLWILASLPLADCSSSSAIRKLSAMFPHGDWLGEACGIARKDDVSGPLTLSFTLLTVTETGLSGQFDSRVPICAGDRNCRLVIEDRLGRLGFSVEGAMQKPHHTPGDGAFVRTLLACYETYTGKKGECRYTGGGTYVHDIEGGVAFGAGMPGFDSHLHGANERMNIADMLCAAKIFALAIARLCGEA